MVSGKDLQEQFSRAHQDQYLQVTVSDTGVGMTEVVRSHVFEPFFTTKDRGKGTGLGLSVVYGVVKSHQGFIDVSSELGSGAAFSLYFPMITTRLYDPGDEDLTALPGGAETILLVEDEEVLLDLIKNLLEKKRVHGPSCKGWYGCCRGFSKNSADIDLVLTDLDYRNGRMAGFLENERRKTRVERDYRERIHRKRFAIKSDAQKGQKDFVQKPYFFNEIRKVRSVLDCQSVIPIPL